MSKKNGKWVVGVILLAVAVLSFISVMIQGRIDRMGAAERAPAEAVGE